MVDFTSYEYKATLSTTANTRAELQDIYDSAITETLNDTTTFYRVVNKVPNKGDYASWTVRSARNSSAGSNSELGDVTSGYSTRKKLTQALTVQTAFVEVSDFEVAAQASAGVSPVDIYTLEVRDATNDLLSTATTGVNAQMFLAGTGNGGLDLTGVKAWVDDSSGTISGVTTLGGLARASNSFLNATVANTTTEPISISRMRSTIASLQDAGAHMDRMLIVTTAALRGRILDLMQSGQRFTTEAKFGFGVMTLPVFDDLPVYSDKDCESGKVYFLDMSVLEMRLLKDFHYEDMAKTAMSRKGKIAMYGELICKAPVFCGVLTNKS